MLHIAPNDRVLEIGSGNRPHRRSNVLCDRYVDDNSERAGGNAIVIDKRPFVVADAAALPFEDKSFDYVIASHVLEHVDDPAKVASEMMRVAKAGYIETPSELSEHLFGWSFHKWMVHREGTTLVFRKRTRDSDFGEYFHRASTTDVHFAEFIDQHYDDFYVRYEWRDTIDIRIERDDTSRVFFNDQQTAPETMTRLRVGFLHVLYGMAALPLRLSRHLRKASR